MVASKAMTYLRQSKLFFESCSYRQRLIIIYLTLFLISFLCYISWETAAANVLRDMRPSLNPFVIVINTGIIFSVILLLAGVINLYYSTFFVLTSYSVVSLANVFKGYYAGEPLAMSDLIWLKSPLFLLKMSGGKLAVVSILALLLMMFFLVHRLQGFLLKAGDRAKKYSNLGAAAFIGFFASGAYRSVQYLDTRFEYMQWSTAATFTQNGLPMYLQIISTRPAHSVPENYSMREIDRIVRENNAWHESCVSPEPVDVVVIVSESFYDFKQFPGMTVSGENLPFFHSVQENKYSGRLYGTKTTGNSEAEFLCSIPSGFFSKGEVPFVNEAEHLNWSLVNLFKKEGFSRVAIHPYIRTNYRRHVVYKNLGFDKYISEKDFPATAEKLPFISDMALNTEILRQLRKNRNKSNLVYAVSMQNHQPWENSDFLKNKYPHLDFQHPSISNDSAEADIVRSQLRLLRYTDESVKELVGIFSKSKKKTLLVLFSDHVPKFSPAIREAMGDDVLQSAASSFLIWANYPINLEIPKFVSIGYLSNIALDLAGIGKDPQRILMGKLYQEFPVYSDLLIADKSGKVYYSLPINFPVVRDAQLLSHDLLAGEQYYLKLLKESGVWGEAF